MRARILVAHAALCLAVGALSACQHVGPQASGAADTDADTDSDTDADSDTDTDSDTGTCAEVLPYCCTEECPCAEAEDRCVYTYDGATVDTYGVCKPETSDGECWIYEDCADGEFCAGGFVCPCESDCDWEGPGTCAPVSGACCEDVSAECSDDYFCLPLIDGTSTCHGMLHSPQCWTDAECYGGTCEGETLCACDVDCMSEPGVCVEGA